MVKNKHLDETSGYRAALQLVNIWANRLNSDNLMQLLGAMNILDFGDSADPAMLHIWRELWGDADLRPESDILEIVSRFVGREGVWDEADTGPEQLVNAIRELQSGNLGDTQILKDWESAIGEASG